MATHENLPWSQKYGALGTVIRTSASIAFHTASVVIAMNEGARRNVRAAGVPNDKIRRMHWGTWGPDLDEFVECYRPGERQKRRAAWSEKKPEGRWRPFTYDEILARDKVSLDLFWLRDESLEDSANLPEPHILAQEIADDLRSALAQIEDVLADLEQRANGGT